MHLDQIWLGLNVRLMLVVVKVLACVYCIYYQF